MKQKEKKKASDSILLRTSTKRLCLQLSREHYKMSPTFPEKCMRFFCQFFKTENSLTTKVPPTTIKMFFKVINTVLFFSLPYTSEIDIENTFLYFFLFMYQA